MSWTAGVLLTLNSLFPAQAAPVASTDTGWIDPSFHSSKKQDPRVQELLRLVQQTVQDGQPDEALTHAIELVEYVEANLPNNNRALADAYCAQGVSLVELDRFEEAREVFTRFVEPSNASRSPETLDHLFCHVVRAQAESLLGDRDEARAMLRALIADPYWQTNGEALDLASAYRSLAILLSRQGRFGDAEPLARKAYAMIGKALPPNHFRVGNVRQSLAQILFQSGQFEAAVPLLEETIEHRTEQLGADHPTSLQLRSALASVLIAAGRGEQAVDTIRVVHNAFVEQHGADSTFALRSGGLLGRALRADGRIGEARDAYRSAHEGYVRIFGASHPETLSALAKLASIAIQTKDLDAARRRVGELAARRFAILPLDHIDRSTVWFLIGDLIALEDGSRAQSIFAYKKAINILQNVRANMRDLPDEAKAAFIAQQLRQYERLQSWLVGEGRFAEAEQVGRMIKQTEYIGFLRAGSSNSADLTLETTPSEEDWSRQFGGWLERPGLIARELREAREAGAADEKIAQLQKASDQAYTQYRQQLNSWLAEVSGLEDSEIRQEAEALNVAQSDRLQDLVAGLGDDVAMVQIVALPDSVSFFVITPDAFIHRQAPIARETLFEQVFEGRESILYSDEDEVQATLKVLHDALFAPIAQDLRDAEVKTLMLNLQGRLRYVPFAALYDGQRYVVEEFELARFTPSAGIVINGSDASSNGAGFGLSQAVSGFSPLPAVERELAAVFANQSDKGVLTGEVTLNRDFTRARLEQELSKRVPILHIASHFQMNSGDASQSFLILGDGTRLTLSEISFSGAMRFRGVELVTLSACSTGLAGEGTGLEVEGLGALIQNKGADAVMSTLWNVSDDATADLMIDFYSGFTRDGLSKAAALRRAQITMIQSDKSNPFFWAPFILSGDWK
ncbi:MAG: CHAT domain-containing protein [Pseudomonadota bacterium]